MPRAIWKGSLTFGLVNVPVELHTAVRDARPRFRMLHGKDMSPIEFQRVCARDGKPVAWEDLVKGFEYAKGQYVTLTKDDFQTAALEKSRTIEILEFVDAAVIDDRFFEQPYYLTPTKGSEHAYAVMREALRKSGRIGVARFIMRETQHLAALEASGDALVLTMMRFAEELVASDQFSLPSKSLVRDKELDMAVSLVNSLSEAWEPEKYKDEYAANLMRIIQSKLKGKRPRLKEENAPPRQAEVIDLMTRLRESLNVSKGKSAGGTKARAKSSSKSVAARKTGAGAASTRKPTRARSTGRKAKRGSRAA
jgi:DNA end-binding protein Ku